MTLKSIALLLESRGHQIRYSIRSDGGIRIKEIDGKVYNLSEGNAVARQLAGKPASPASLSQRVQARANIDKQLSKYLIRQKKQRDRILSAPPSKRKTQEQKDRLREHKAAEKFQKQREKWLKQYQKEQEKYKKLRKQGLTSKQALKIIKKTSPTGIPLSPTTQHAKYVQELLKVSNGDFAEIQTLLQNRKARDTLRMFRDRLSAGLTSDEYNNLSTLDGVAKGINYDIRNASDSESEEDVRRKSAAPFEMELRKWLENKGIKNPAKQNISDIMPFFWSRHRTDLWRKLNEGYKAGSYSEDRINNIRSSINTTYQAANLTHQKALSRAVIKEIESML